MGWGEAPLTEVRWLPKGHTIGVERPVVLRRPTRVAVLPVGYRHGFGVDRPRESGFWAAWRRWKREKKRFVRVGGQKARVLGGIGATETVLDITSLHCSARDTAVFDIDPLYAKGFRLEYR